MKRLHLILSLAICFTVLFMIGCEGYSGNAETEPDPTPTPEVPAPEDNTAGIISVRSYGAMGDGTTDDTAAIQAAVSSDDTVYFPAGTYRISRPIEITDKRFWSLYGQDACFEYTGDDYAFRINAAESCSVSIGEIIARSGGGILFYSENPRKWNQYVNLSFRYIECATDCIHVRVTGGWSNENQIYGGRFAGGKNGVNIEYRAGDILNGWKFYNCGIEGVDNGFLLDAGNGYIADIAIINSRYAESFNTILKTTGNVLECLWIGTNVVKPDMIECSSQTDRFEIAAPIGQNGHRGCITAGRLMTEKTEYEEASW